MLPDIETGLKGLGGIGAGHGYLEAVGKYSTATGAAVRAEFGMVPKAGLRIFGYGEGSKLGIEAGAGVRWTF